MTPTNDGTNCCTFLSLKICHEWSSQQNHFKKDWETFSKKVETIITDFPSRINPYRDIEQHYRISEATEIMSKYALIKETIKVVQVTSSKKVFSKEGLEDIVSAMNQMTSIVVMVCPPYTFVIGNFQGELFIIDTHVIRNQ